MELSHALSYSNLDVELRFQKLVAVTPDEAADIFYETKKWLWLCAKAAHLRKAQDTTLFVPDKMVIHSHSLQIIDEMWHNFLCFTKEYEYFCTNYLGIFVHHNPATLKTNQILIDLENNVPGYLDQRLTNQMRFVYDELGEETLEKWYDAYSLKYSTYNIKQLKKKLLI